MYKLIMAVLLSLSFSANAALVTVLGYTFEDSATNTFEGLIVDYDTVAPEPYVIEGALDVITSGGVTLFDIDSINPSDVDASVYGFLDGNTTTHVPNPSFIQFEVFDNTETSLGILMEGNLTWSGSGDNYQFDITGGDLAAYFTGGIFTYNNNTFIDGSGDTRFTDDTFTLTMTPSAVPVPAAVWLFGSGLIGMISVARHRNV